MPDRHTNDHQVRRYMRLRLTEPVTAAVKAAASANRNEGEARLPAQKCEPGGRRRPNPLIEIFDRAVAMKLTMAPAIRPVTIFDELTRRYPELLQEVRRMLAQRIRARRAKHRPESAEFSGMGTATHRGGEGPGLLCCRPKSPQTRSGR